LSLARVSTSGTSWDHFRLARPADTLILRATRKSMAAIAW
jgi:hypothetical protein